MSEQTEPIKITSARKRRHVQPGNITSQIKALRRAQKWWDDTETVVFSDWQANTITALRTMRDAIQQELQAVHVRPLEEIFPAQVTLYAVEGKCTECIRRIQAFGEERSTRDVYTRLVRQREIYTLLDDVAQKAATLSPREKG